MSTWDAIDFKLPVDPPRFDRVAVRDIRVFDSVPRLGSFPERLDSTMLLSPALLGIPVFVDADVDPGVIELRKGDEVVERVTVSP